MFENGFPAEAEMGSVRPSVINEAREWRSELALICPEASNSSRVQCRSLGSPRLRWFQVGQDFQRVACERGNRPVPWFLDFTVDVTLVLGHLLP